MKNFANQKFKSYKLLELYNMETKNGIFFMDSEWILS